MQGVITERCSPRSRSLGRNEGRSQEAASSAQLQGLPSSLPSPTLLPLPVSRGGCSLPAKHKRHQCGSVQGKVSRDQEFFSRKMVSADRCMHQMGAAASRHVESCSGCSLGLQFIPWITSHLFALFTLTEPGKFSHGVFSPMRSFFGDGGGILQPTHW